MPPSKNPVQPADPNAADTWIKAKLPAIQSSLLGERGLRPDDMLGLQVITFAGLVGYATRSYPAPIPGQLDAVCESALRAFFVGREKLFEDAGCVRTVGTPAAEAYHAAIREWFHGWFEDVYVTGVNEWLRNGAVRVATLARPLRAEQDARIEVSRPLAVACAFFRAIQASGIYPRATDRNWNDVIEQVLGSKFATPEGVRQVKLDVIPAFDVPGAPPLAFRGEEDGRLHLNKHAVRDTIAAEYDRARREGEAGQRYYDPPPASLDEPVARTDDAPLLRDVVPGRASDDQADRIDLNEALDLLAVKYADNLIKTWAIEFLRHGSSDVARYAEKAGCSTGSISTQAKALLEELRRMLTTAGE